MKKALKITWKIIELGLSQLIEYDKNNKIHWEKQIWAIANSIERFWYINEIVVDKNNIVIIWHWRLESIRKMGYTHTEVKQLDIDSKEAGALRILDNILTEFNSHNNLENIFSEFENGIDLTLWDFTNLDFFPEFNAPNYNQDDYLWIYENPEDRDWSLKVSFILPNPDNLDEVKELLMNKFGVKIIK